MTGELHWFWFAMTLAVIIWYSTITVYIAFRGAFDIKEMLANLSKANEDESQ